VGSVVCGQASRMASSVCFRGNRKGVLRTFTHVCGVDVGLLGT
jgi:hypothetical protein